MINTRLGKRGIVSVGKPGLAKQPTRRYLVPTMSSMIDKLEFVIESGSITGQDLTIYALSTCAFCKRAIDFLKDKDIAFRYIYLDKINPLVKGTVKSELKKQYDNLPVFPILVIDNNRALSGFSEEKWRAELGIRSET